MKIDSQRPMPRRTFLAAASLGVAGSPNACNRSAGVQIKTSSATDALTELVWSEVKENNVDRYLRAAVELQRLGKEVAGDVLYSYTKELSDPKNEANKRRGILYTEIAALCRMLFTKRSNSELRRARIGGATFLGGTNYGDWPLEPIEIVDGVPFTISQGYLIAGEAEPAYFYVGYCLGNCDWNEFKFVLKTAQQKQDALDKLLASPKWRRKLTVSDKEFFAAQIR